MISNAAEALESVSFATMLFWLLPVVVHGLQLMVGWLCGYLFGVSAWVRCKTVYKV